jgi:transcriptional regulator GlxA family with amidase domain
LSPILRELPTRLDTMPDATRGRVAVNLLDLIAVALTSSGGRPSSAALTLARIKSWIEVHLGEELSAETIAMACGISTRHLNRVFGGEGVPPMQYVLERRLARCHRDLLDETKQAWSITAIAFAAGFKDLSHFSRTYRTHYGRTATEERVSVGVTT